MVNKCCAWSGLWYEAIHVPSRCPMGVLPGSCMTSHVRNQQKSQEHIHQWSHLMTHDSWFIGLPRVGPAITIYPVYPSFIPRVWKRSLFMGLWSPSHTVSSTSLSSRTLRHMDGLPLNGTQESGKHWQTSRTHSNKPWQAATRYRVANSNTATMSVFTIQCVQAHITA